MAIGFRMAKHSATGLDIVEILMNRKVVGVIYPKEDKGIKIVSAHISASEVEEGFVGKVVEDDGSESFPPIPAVLIDFNPSPYEIRNSKIIKIPNQSAEEDDKTKKRFEVICDFDPSRGLRAFVTPLNKEATNILETKISKSGIKKQKGKLIFELDE